VGMIEERLELTHALREEQLVVLPEGLWRRQKARDQDDQGAGDLTPGISNSVHHGRVGSVATHRVASAAEAPHRLVCLSL
jgi:hypothetical protein